MENHFPQPLTKEELAELMPSVMLRNKEAQDKVIKHHLRLAFHIARKFVKDRRSFIRSDDLVGEAFLLLTQAVERFPSVARDLNITPYIGTTIERGLKEFLVRDNLIYTPNESKVFATIKSYDSEIHDPTTIIQSNLDITDFIENSIDDQVQKMIIKMRLVDYSDKEIAETLKIGTDQVCRLRQCVGIAHKISER